MAKIEGWQFSLFMSWKVLPRSRLLCQPEMGQGERYGAWQSHDKRLLSLLTAPFTEVLNTRCHQDAQRPDWLKDISMEFSKDPRDSIISYTWICWPFTANTHENTYVHIYTKPAACLEKINKPGQRLEMQQLLYFVLFSYNQLPSWHLFLYGPKASRT